MAKNKFAYLTLSILTFLHASFAYAAGDAQLMLTASRSSVGIGESFTVTATINPGGAAIDTARAQLAFSSDILQAQSVALVGKLNNALPNNFIDNNAGTVSWGGYAIQNPVSSANSLIRVTFRAAAAGSAQISTQSGSRLVSQGQEKFSGNQSTVKVTVGSAQPDAGSQTELRVTSPSHPEPSLWYTKDLVQLTWTEIDGATYLYSFDQEPDSAPTRSISATSINFKRVQSGIHYFHIRAKRADGSLTSVVNFPVQVDTASPNRFSPYLEANSEGKLTVRFATTDNHSGVDRYDLALNSVAVQSAASPYELANAKVGENLVEIDAYDKAGNFTRGWIKFVINPDGSFRVVGQSQRACGADLFCLPALLSKPVIGGVIFALTVLLLWLFGSRRKKRQTS